MARSTDTFFIRQSVTQVTGNGFVQQAIDLGSFVDALGKSILRIKSVSVQYTSDQGASALLAPAVDSMFASFWQLTTQSQSTIVTAEDKSVITTGQLYATEQTNTAGTYTAINETHDINPANWSDGYLVATDSIYLGGLCRGSPGNSAFPVVTIVLECEVTTMSQSAAMALALSQQ